MKCPACSRHDRSASSDSQYGLADECGLGRLATATPFDRRGLLVRLHPPSRREPLEVVASGGHSPAVMFKHHAKVIEELVGGGAALPVVPSSEEVVPTRRVPPLLATVASCASAVVQGSGRAAACAAAEAVAGERRQSRPPGRPFRSIRRGPCGRARGPRRSAPGLQLSAQRTRLRVMT
jgi:hypothetical protein